MGTMQLCLEGWGDGWGVGVIQVGEEIRVCVLQAEGVDLKSMKLDDMRLKLSVVSLLNTSALERSYLD